MLKNLYLCVFLFGSLGIATSGCDEADQAVDCSQICNRYQDCFDEDYDVEACIDRCRPLLEKDPHAADECDECIDDRSCSGAVFNCATDCVGIVP